MSERLSRHSSELLETVETAKIVRLGLLSLSEYGSMGSTAPIPQESEQQAVKIPQLLRYTSTTINHFQTLFNTLSQPREFQFASVPNQSWQQGVETSDVVYSQEYFGDIFTFPNQLTSPDLNPLVASISKPQGQPFQGIDLIRFRDASFRARIKPHASLNGVWKLAYSYSVGYPSTVEDPQFLEGAVARAIASVGSGGIYEDMRRSLLLQFILVPHPVTAQFFIQNFFPPDFLSGFSSLPKETYGARNNFEVHNIIFDPSPLIRKYSQEDGPHSCLESLYTKNETTIHLLRKIGLSHISIVGLGQLQIGKQKYSVYSQAEWPLVTAQEKESSTILQRILTPQFARHNSWK